MSSGNAEVENALFVEKDGKKAADRGRQHDQCREELEAHHEIPEHVFSPWLLGWLARAKPLPPDEKEASRTAVL